MQNLSQSALIVIALLVIFILAINVWLFSASRNKTNKNSTFNLLRNSTKVLQNPFMEENKKLEELSKLSIALQEAAQKEFSSERGDLNEY